MVSFYRDRRLASIRSRKGRLDDAILSTAVSRRDVVLRRITDHVQMTVIVRVGRRSDASHGLHVRPYYRHESAQEPT